MSPCCSGASRRRLKLDLNNTERTCLFYFYFLDIKRSSACFITFV